MHKRVGNVAVQPFNVHTNVKGASSDGDRYAPRAMGTVETYTRNIGIAKEGLSELSEGEFHQGRLDAKIL